MQVNTFNGNTTGRFISILSNDINTIEVNYVENIIKLFRQSVLAIGGLGMMIYLNIPLFLCSLAASLLPVAVSMICGRNVDKLEKNVSVINEKFLSVIKDIISGFSVVKSFKSENEVFKEYIKINEYLENNKKKKRYAITNIEILSNAASFFVVFVVFAFGTYLTINGQITVGVVMAFIQLFNYVIQPFQEIPVFLAKMNSARGVMEKINDVLYIENEEKELSVDSFNNSICFENVSFGYDESKVVLNNISLKFEKNKSYAIVGASGSGKSTLLNLMLGFYSNYSGKILFDGKEIKNIKTSSLYNLFSIIQQNVFIFNNSIKDNITMLKKFEEEDIENAIKLAGLSKLVNEKGIEYKCGESGEKLSGGERQRISIARSLIKDTPILLMDEATAALDNQTTTAVEEAILALDKVTRILITHRLNENTLKSVDNIIVIKNGRVVEEGKFSELIERKGYFYSLYNLTNE